MRRKIFAILLKDKFIIEIKSEKFVFYYLFY